MTPSTEIRSHYQSYLLRVWHEESEAGWRATLQNVKDGEVQHFSEVQELVDVLTDGSALTQTGEGDRDREEDGYLSVAHGCWQP